MLKHFNIYLKFLKEMIMKLNVLKVTMLTLTSYALFGCNGNGNDASASNANMSLKSLPSDVVDVSSVSHGNADYYTAKSDGANYQVMLVKNTSKANLTISNFAIKQDADNAFANVTATAGVLPAGVQQCTDGVVLRALGAYNNTDRCAYAVKLNYPQSGLLSTAKLVVTPRGSSFPNTTVLTQSPILYVVGKFNSATNGAGSVSDNDIGNCGDSVNGSKGCPIVKYNIASGILSKVASSDAQLYSLVMNDDGYLFATGDATTLRYGNTVISSQSQDYPLLAKINPTVNGGVVDFFNSNGYTAPQDRIYSIAYDYATRDMFFGGGFQTLGSVSESVGYPIVAYNETTGLFRNALGAAGNPSGAVTALAAKSNKLWVGGMFQSIAGVDYSAGLNESQGLVMRYTLNGTTYDTPESVVTTAVYSNLPYPAAASSVAIDGSGRVYVTGLFALLGNFSTYGNEFPIFFADTLSSGISSGWNQYFQWGGVVDQRTNVIATTSGYESAPNAATRLNHTFMGGYFTVNDTTSVGGCAGGRGCSFIEVPKGGADAGVIFNRFNANNTINTAVVSSEITASR